MKRNNPFTWPKIMILSKDDKGMFALLEQRFFMRYKTVQISQIVACINCMKYDVDTQYLVLHHEWDGKHDYMYLFLYE